MGHGEHDDPANEHGNHGNSAHSNSEHGSTQGGSGHWQRQVPPAVPPGFIRFHGAISGYAQTPTHVIDISAPLRGNLPADLVARGLSSLTECSEGISSLKESIGEGSDGRTEQNCAAMAAIAQLLTGPPMVSGGIDKSSAAAEIATLTKQALSFAGAEVESKTGVAKFGQRLSHALVETVKWTMKRGKSTENDEASKASSSTNECQSPEQGQELHQKGGHCYSAVDANELHMKGAFIGAVRSSTHCLDISIPIDTELPKDVMWRTIQELMHSCKHSKSSAHFDHTLTAIANLCGYQDAKGSHQLVADVSEGSHERFLQLENAALHKELELTARKLWDLRVENSLAPKRSASTRTIDQIGYAADRLCGGKGQGATIHHLTSVVKDLAAENTRVRLLLRECIEEGAVSSDCKKVFDESKTAKQCIDEDHKDHATTSEIEELRKFVLGYKEQNAELLRQLGEERGSLKECREELESLREENVSLRNLVDLQNSGKQVETRDASPIKVLCPETFVPQSKEQLSNGLLPGGLFRDLKDAEPQTKSIPSQAQSDQELISTMTKHIADLSTQLGSARCKSESHEAYDGQMQNQQVKLEVFASQHEQLAEEVASLRKSLQADSVLKVQHGQLVDVVSRLEREVAAQQRMASAAQSEASRLRASLQVQLERTKTQLRQEESEMPHTFSEGNSPEQISADGTPQRQETHGTSLTISGISGISLDHSQEVQSARKTPRTPRQAVEWLLKREAEAVQRVAQIRSQLGSKVNDSGQMSARSVHSTPEHLAH